MLLWQTSQSVYIKVGCPDIRYEVGREDDKSNPWGHNIYVLSRNIMDGGHKGECSKDLENKWPEVEENQN